MYLWGAMSLLKLLISYILYFQPNTDLVVGYMNADGEPVVMDMWTLG